MANEPVVHIGENSQEQVAYKLMADILRANGKELVWAGSDGAASEAEIIRAYELGRQLVKGFPIDRA